MERAIRIAMVQSDAVSSLDEFATQLKGLVAAHPETELFVFPEFHVLGDLEAMDPDAENAAQPLDGPLTTAFASLARELGIWLVPGTFLERDERGLVHNTVVVLSPAGEMVASYRKVFPWRPVEPSAPGDAFVVFPLNGGVVGLLVCYDAWFPEASRQLAWMGAELILNVVMTPTPDREQEVVLARSNAIVNQVYVASVNAAAPRARGRSLLADPEGRVVVGTTSADEMVLTATVDLDQVTRIRRDGTAGVTTPWRQFRPGDVPLALPVYGGAIEPPTWAPPPPGSQRQV
ncbi:MAG: carbon-nitrogen hydrolase family protein [Nocardioidaceae bacterium]|nr:carbon-nitrogen hydrolase family protein [Nocardioidaceae bacterium]